MEKDLAEQISESFKRLKEQEKNESLKTRSNLSLFMNTHYLKKFRKRFEIKKVVNSSYERYILFDHKNKKGQEFMFSGCIRVGLVRIVSSFRQNLHDSRVERRSNKDSFLYRKEYGRANNKDR